jgi:hypothetical protein
MSRYAPITASAYFFIGEDKTLAFTVYDPTATEPEIKAGTALTQDITAWTMEFTVRRDPQSVAVTFTKTTDDDVVIIDGSLGQVDVYIRAADTQDLTDGVYYYTLRRSDPDHHNDLAHGEFVMQLGATR